MSDFVRGLQRFARVLWFDMRGIGMSSSVAGGVIPVETWMDDLVAVLDAAGSSKATIVAQGHAVQMARRRGESSRACPLARAHERLRAVHAGGRLPRRPPHRARRRFPRSHRGTVGHGSRRLRSRPVDRGPAGGPGVVGTRGALRRDSALARAKMRAIFDLDVRNVLPLVSVPTLVVHNAAQRLRPRRPRALPRGAHRRRPVARAGQARPLAVAGGGSPRGDRGVRHRDADTDVGSGPGAGDGCLHRRRRLDRSVRGELGDHGWRSALERFERDVQDALPAVRRRRWRTPPATACSRRSTARRGGFAARGTSATRFGAAGCHVRCGLHAGEVMRRARGLAGIAVHIGARVSAMATGEVLVTRTVRDLVAGSGISIRRPQRARAQGRP